MTTKSRMKGLGFRPDLPDIRDFTFESGIIKKKKTVPSCVDLRKHLDMPPIYDQKELGSCTAQAVGALCDFEYGTDHNYSPSALFLYYVTRSLEGTVDIDAGASIRNSIKAANEFGVAPLSMWPYVIEKFKETPPNVTFEIAMQHQAIGYRRVRQRLDDLRECLAEENLIAFGICVYEGLYKVTRKNPTLELPDYSQSLEGGHALVLVGYDDDKQHFIVRNSWGESYGVHGYFYIPYTYVLNPQLSMDFWQIHLMEK